MVRRILASTLVALLVVALFVPTGLAAPNPPPADRTVAVEGPGDDDGFLVDRIQAALFSPVPARGGETLRSQPSDRLERERERDRDGVLEQSTRAAIYRAIDEAPGRTLSALAEVVGVTPSTVRYHVDVLRDAGFVDAVEASGALRFAPADADLEVVAALDADGTGSVLRAVAEHEPVSVTALADATDRAPSTVSHHLSGLEARGLVERERVGESVATTLSPAARSTLGGEATVSADD